MNRRSRRRQSTEAELNITTFMNLMVVLVPFLLITAVFSQVSILRLNLPATSPSQQEEEQKKPIVLEVLIYKNRLEVVDRQTGPLKIIPNKADGTHDFDTMVTTLKAVKKRFPEVTDITLLLEADTPYELLVKAMDMSRQTDQEVNGIKIKAALFPDIAIGDAPPDHSAGGDA